MGACGGSEDPENLALTTKEPSAAGGTVVRALLKVLAISVQGANQLISDDSSHHLFWRGTTHPPRDCPLLLLSQFHLQGHLPRHLREFLLGPGVRPAWQVCWIRITASSSFTLR
jgi:hypothetical protein